MAKQSQSQKLIYVLDTETTGEKPPEAAVCEIAAVPVSFSGKVLLDQAKSCLVNPGHLIPADCRAVHHISDADVKGSPGIEKVIAGPFKHLNGAVICAHNMAYDRQFIDPHLEGHQNICTLRLARHLYPDAPNHKNQTLRYYLGCEPPAKALEGMAPHRALYDAVVTAYILSFMLKENTADELIELSASPILYKNVPFGAHKGKLWEDVPRDYLGWILSKDFDDDIKHTARYWQRAVRSGPVAGARRGG